MTAKRNSENNRTKDISISEAHPMPLTDHAPSITITAEERAGIKSWVELGEAIRGQQIDVYISAHDFHPKPNVRVTIGKERATILDIDDAGVMTIEYDASPGWAMLSTDDTLTDLIDTGVILFSSEYIPFGSFNYSAWGILCVRVREDA